jgi:hypothetical protein
VHRPILGRSQVRKLPGLAIPHVTSSTSCVILIKQLGLEAWKHSGKLTVCAAQFLILDVLRRRTFELTTAHPFGQNLRSRRIPR